VLRPEAADAAPSPSLINVLDYGAQGDYDPSLPTSDPGNMANLAANNAAFANAWAAARSAKGILYIPVGYYGIGPGILATTTNDAGILGESIGNTTLFLIDPNGTGTCVSQSITDIPYWTTTTLPLRGRSLPPITGFTIDGTFAGSGSVGLRVGPGIKGYWDVSARWFNGTGGANGVTGLTGGIGILVQNTKDDGGTVNRWTEECTFGPRTAVNHCTNGLVIDKHDGAYSFGYNTFEHLFVQLSGAGAVGVAIMNNAWLYNVDAHVHGNADGGPTLFLMRGTPAAPGPPYEPNLARLAGNVSINVEINSGPVTTFDLDADSVWITSGLIDVLTWAGLGTTSIAGRFHHTGPCGMSGLPPVDGWIPNAAFVPGPRVSGSSNHVSVFTLYGDTSNRFTRGTRVRWSEGGTLKYGVVDRDSTYSPNLTTVTLAPNTDYWMAVSPDVGSLRYSHANPPDFPGWFNYTPVFTGFSVPPPSGSYRFRVDGTRCEVELRDATNGTSNSTVYTISLPITCATLTDYAVAFPAQVTDNGGALTTPGAAQFGSGSTVANMFKNYASGPWTNSGGKRCNRVTIVYEI
jgi:hypothetical protein